VSDRLPRPWWGRTALLAVLVIVAALVLGSAAPASAHATLISSDPAEGAVVAAAPEQIRFVFDETVVGVPNAVHVFDAEGGQVAASSAVSGRELTATLTDPVGAGTLVVAWRVLSVDGHPISGSLTFSVESPSAVVTPPPSSSAGTSEVPRALTLARWGGYLGLFLAAGLVAFTVLFLPTSPGANGARKRLVTVGRSAAALAAMAWLAGLPLTVTYQFGGGASSLAEGATWSALSPVEYAVVAAVVGGLTLSVGLLGRGLPARPRAMAALAAGAIATCAPALTGHTRAASPEVLVVGVGMLHLEAGSIWLGGLVALALVLPDLAGRGSTGADVLARFSAVGAGVLAALAVTGSTLAWRIVGSWSALFDTGYGQLLLMKVAIVAVVALIAAWNRWSLMPLVQRALRGRDRRAGARLVARATAAEAACLVAVLLLTGLLVDKSPEPRGPVAGSSRPAVRTGTLGDVELQATVSPAVTGPSTVTIEMRDSAGEPFEGFEAPRARLSSAEVDLGEVSLSSVAPGTYAGEVVLPSPGTWELQVSLRVSEFENPVTTLDFTVGSG
jgi:copper transport protein